MLSIHDNEILSYEVDLQNSKIKLHTIGGHNDSVNIIIEFTDVLAHMFETQLQGSIIFDISTLEISRFLKHNKELLEKQKNYGWPMVYESLDEFLEHLQHEKYNFYVISASYGLNGWVVAKDYKTYN